MLTSLETRFGLLSPTVLTISKLKPTSALQIVWSGLSVFSPVDLGKMKWLTNGRLYANVRGFE
jgi:hypothetical protein